MPSMFIKPLFFLFFFYFFLLLNLISSEDDKFTFNGFSSANMTLNGVASITSNGLLALDNTIENTNGHAFHPVPIHFKIPGDQYLGLFNITNNGDLANHIFAVELDTIQNPEFQDINDNHVGIDINSLNSHMSHTAGYFENSTGLFKNLTLRSGQSMQVWIDFDGQELQLTVTLSPLGMPKPNKPLLSSAFDLASVMLDPMYIGFSASTGPFHTFHYILGWSFNMDGAVENLNYTKLPSIPLIEAKGNSDVFAISLPISSSLFVLLIVVATMLIVRRRMKYAELLEDWEIEYGPHRFSYKDLCQATKGFKDKELLGTGGFGRVYRGVFPTSKMEVAVKKISHESRQGMREFVAEIVSIGQLRHRNLVQLLGYCRRKSELLLVYEFMPHGSLDKFLYDHTKPTLNWAQRFRIIKGVASGLLYLHEDWEQVVLHRDIKASNVLLDSELNGKLGDFGLAKLYDRGTDPQTTHVVGTMGYISPELALTGKATTATDVFAFGAFLLEVVCGRRPIVPHTEGQKLLLVDWVLESWRQGSLIETIDSRLGEDYCTYEVELILKLGLICSHPMPAARPSARKVMQILDGNAELPEPSTSFLSFSSLSSHQNIAFDDYIQSFGSSTATISSLSVSGR